MDLIKNKIKQIDPRIEPKDEKTFIHLIALGVIPDKGFECFKCKSKVVLWLRQRDSKSVSHISWRCSNGKCHGWISCLDNSFFGTFKKPINTLIKIIKYWCCQVSIVKTVELLKLDSDIDVTRKTVGLVFQRLRDVCSRAIRDDKRKLGGRGTVVEMDESLVFKIKYNRGSGLKRKQIWVFGMVERKDYGLCHIQIVKNRKAETLLAIIYDRVKESSIIHSD